MRILENLENKTKQFILNPPTKIISITNSNSENLQHRYFTPIKFATQVHYIKKILHNFFTQRNICNTGYQEIVTTTKIITEKKRKVKRNLQ